MPSENLIRYISSINIQWLISAYSLETLHYSDFNTTNFHLQHPPHNPYSYCGDPPIRTEDTYIKLKHLWNNGVTYVFHGLANLPNMFTKIETIEEETKKEPPCVAYSELSEEEKSLLSNNVYKQW